MIYIHAYILFVRKTQLHTKRTEMVVAIKLFAWLALETITPSALAANERES